MSQRDVLRTKETRHEVTDATVFSLSLSSLSFTFSPFLFLSLSLSRAHAARLGRTKRGETPRSIFRGVDLVWSRGAWPEGG